MYGDVFNNTSNLNAARNCKQRGTKGKKRSYKSVVEVEVLYLILGTFQVVFIEGKRTLLIMKQCNVRTIIRENCKFVFIISEINCAVCK